MTDGRSVWPIKVQASAQDRFFVGVSQMVSVEVLGKDLMVVKMPPGAGFIISVSDLANPDEKIHERFYKSPEDESTSCRIVIQQSLDRPHQTG